ncbi:iron-containing alcohol dehydrogenase [Balneola vulgaris]|jgi:NADP-dependent alcohol dehydrogenase|uniref:iron-containing alcohol dehydrogenase n=1 Tax=Balneola vulgaris TaxID=287535 RepID=UPI00037DA01B|nr:iron-containing alcohol dehydrogenase [Balneola vulgaris]
MLNFEFHNPTKVLFGKGQIAKIKNEIPEGSKVLMVYGGGSIKKNGVYDQVTKALEDFEVVEFQGVPPNPEYAILMEAVKIVKDQNIDYLLAVGGGSVIDGVKFISSAAKFDGEDAWDILAKGIRTYEGVPFGTVLTLPATGSEMNSGSVITRAETKEKRTMGGPGLFPQFSVLDPEVVHSIPKRQIANGLVDSFSHVIEQYLTYPVAAKLQDRIAESVMQTLIEVAPKIMKDPSDYDAASDFMWSCTMALNGLLRMGTPNDWATHMMAHELTALYGIDHARTLAIIHPSHLRHNFEDKKEKLAQYGERVWGIRGGTIEEIAEQAIQKTEEYFHSLEIDTKLSAYTEDYEGTAEIIAKRFKERGWEGLGERKNVTPDDAAKIVSMSY